MTCPSPHPVRASDGLSLDSCLEVIGSYGTESWARCRACGAFFWLSTDVDGRFEYVAAVPLEKTLAERAFVAGELGAVADVLVRNGLPDGPVWQAAKALAELFRELTIGCTDEARAKAIEALLPKGRWSAASKVLALDAQLAKLEAPSPLAFVVDAQVAGARYRDHQEVGPSLVLLPDGPPHELWRLDSRALVKLPLSGAPTLRASAEDRLLFTIDVAEGEAVLVLDQEGLATAWPAIAGRGSVAALDDGFWLFVPPPPEAERWIALHLPDGRPFVKLRRRFAPNESTMPRPRRFAEGWILSNLMDDDGNVQSLTLFDASFATVAFSTATEGERGVTPIDERSFWASTSSRLELWRRGGRDLREVVSFAARASHALGDLRIVDVGSGELLALASDGSVRWRWHRSSTGATYVVVTSRGLVFYDDERADLIDRAGSVVVSRAVEDADVAVGRDGTGYLKSGAELWIVNDRMQSIVVGSDAQLETTCGDSALLRVRPGEYWLVGPDGGREAFHAPSASFSVVGTSGGPYVLEGERVRVGRFGPRA